MLLGLASTRLTGPAGSAVGSAIDVVGDVAGGVLYAVLVVQLLALVAARARTRTLVAVGFAVCVAVELAQLTGLPAAVGEVLPAARLVLGSTFVATDLLAYAVGCALAGALDARLPRAAPAPVVP